MLVKLVALSCRLLLSRKLCVLKEVTQEKTLCSRRETKRVSWQKSCAQCRFTKLKCYFNSNIVFCISPFTNKDKYYQVFICAILCRWLFLLTFRLCSITSKLYYHCAFGKYIYEALKVTQQDSRGSFAVMVYSNTI